MWVRTALLLCMILAPAGRAETLRVASAISLKDGLHAVAQQYRAETGQEVELTFGSSGQLAAQIRNGAPVDLFISAADKQVEDLIHVGAVEAASRRVVAANALVVIVPADAQVRIDSIQSLADASMKRIAVGEPRTVPAGEYAMQALQRAGAAERVKDKLIFAANVRQVLSYVERSEVSAGLVYSTDALQSGEKVRVAARVDPAMHEPIVYPAVLVKSSRQAAQAKRFVEYLLSDKAQSVLRSHGFVSPAAPSTTRSSP